KQNFRKRGTARGKRRSDRDGGNNWILNRNAFALRNLSQRRTPESSPLRQIKNSLQRREFLLPVRRFNQTFKFGEYHFHARHLSSERLTLHAFCKPRDKSQYGHCQQQEDHEEHRVYLRNVVS